MNTQSTELEHKTERDVERSNRQFLRDAKIKSPEMEHAINFLASHLSADLTRLVRQQEAWERSPRYKRELGWHLSLQALPFGLDRMSFPRHWDIALPFGKVGYDEELLNDVIRRYEQLKSSSECQSLSLPQVSEAIAHVIDAIPTESEIEIHSTKPFFVGGETYSIKALFQWNRIKEHILVEMNGGLPHRSHQIGRIRTAQRAHAQQFAKTKQLICCPRCDRSISPTAPTCPGCGEPIAVTNQLSQGNSKPDGSHKRERREESLIWNETKRMVIRWFWRRGLWLLISIGLTVAAFTFFWNLFN